MTRSDYVDDYLRSEPPPHQDDSRDFETAALRELIWLKADSVDRMETELEARCNREQRTLTEAFERTTRRIARRGETVQNAAKETSGQQVERIRALCDAESSQLEADMRQRRDEIVSDSRNAIETTDKNQQHEIWMAETMADGLKDKLRKEYKRIKVKTSRIVARLDGLDRRARSALQRYRCSPPTERNDVAQAKPETGDPLAAFGQYFAAAQQNLRILEALGVARWSVGVRLWLVLFVVVASIYGVIVGTLAACGLRSEPWFLWAQPALALVAVVGGWIARALLRRSAQRQVIDVYTHLNRALVRSRRAIDLHLREAITKRRGFQAEATAKRNAAIADARRHHEAMTATLELRRATALQQLDGMTAQRRAEIEQCRAAGRHDTQYDQSRIGDVEARYRRYVEMARSRYELASAACADRHEAVRTAFERRVQAGLTCVGSLVDRTAPSAGGTSSDWSDPTWAQWTPGDVATTFRFGQLRADLSCIAERVRRHAPYRIGPNSVATVPALLALPDRGSLLIQSGPDGREQALGVLRSVMARLLTSLAPGRARFMLIDPVGLGETFASFMHLADYDENLIGGRIWTDPTLIEQRLAQLTGHMENVIQKYLRNDFDTIDAYNRQAGELAEPYRFLMIADFPTGFGETAARHLGSILNSGARCGVYTLIAQDTRQPLPPGIGQEDLPRAGTQVMYRDGGFVWQDDVLEQFPLTLDRPPADDTLTRMLHAVGRATKDAARVEIPFDVIAPSAETRWTGDSSDCLSVPVGRTGATRLQYLTFGRGVAQHALVAGKTGSGKSNLLHVIITNLALWYRPDELELYLVDFKKGVEFKAYATHALAHARAIAIESDREFGLSVLQRLDREMERRGDLFRKLGVQDVASYRRASGGPLPRSLLIVDEFHVLFAEDDKLGQDAAMLLDRLVRQGRAFGIHVLLGSQSLGGTSGLARSTMGQMAIRIALQCSEADSQLILDDTNVAARLLSRPGEAIYNDAGGQVDGNNPFQTAFLPPERRADYLAAIRDLGVGQPARPEPPIVFEGSTDADVMRNRPLATLLGAATWPAPPSPARAWLGEPVAIKDPTSVPLPRQSGANLIMVGQQDTTAMAMTMTAMVSLAAQHRPESAQFVVLDGCPADSPTAGYLEQVTAALPHSAQMVAWRDVAEVMNALATEVQDRLSSDATERPSIYVVIFGLQRYRMLRRREDEFAFSTSDSDEPPSPDKRFVEILREGPRVGVHILAWSDTLAALERTIDRQAMAEFGSRVLLQMSAADSSNLIDSPAANSLGYHRAIYYNEELGVVEKFRPYARIDQAWLNEVGESLANRR